jgi:hypothetical protein
LQTTGGKAGSLARHAEAPREFSLPTGASLPAVAAHGPPWEVWEISAEGGAPRQLTQLFTDGPWPAWSPDGAHLVALQPGAVLLLNETAPVYLGSALGHGEVVWTE